MSHLVCLCSMYAYMNNLLMTIHKIKDVLSIGKHERTAGAELGGSTAVMFVADTVGLVSVVLFSATIMVGSVASGSTSG